METMKDALDDYMKEYELTMVCPKCKTDRASKMKVQRMFVTYPRLFMIKIDRINDDQTINHAKMENISKSFDLEGNKFNLSSIITIHGDSLETCKYKHIRKYSDDWVIKGAIH